ncbi:hypothetical protein P3102_30010 [Amycolatopsis sp. QT-25]|uniref:hypothetical protein n=1 Tax=Amycolatopsis sp. QT-25 TaxID=3034022 RepID=UPI0023EAD014|nr:hypothetical protein [Amycolatopsis sp. QT-25]WET78264.1 hypothetical protein P3102_30010 [Amycolatopsis sp. QT-25]
MSETEKTVEAEENPHAKVVLQAANAMTKASLKLVPPAVLICIVVFTILNGQPGLLGSVIGGVLALVSALATLGLMRFSAGMDPMFVMVIALGGYVLKVVVLFAALSLLRGVTAIHPMALGVTMIVAILVAAAVEFAAFRKTKIPTIIPASR